jgi:hypothetical protein
MQESAMSCGWLLKCSINQRKTPPGPHCAAGTCAAKAARARQSCVRTGGGPLANFMRRVNKLSLRLAIAAAGSSSKSRWTCKGEKQSFLHASWTSPTEEQDMLDRESAEQRSSWIEVC